METASENLYWMSFNLSLAALGLVFGWMFFYVRKPIALILFFILWVLFIPNTIYLITDLQYLPGQWLEADLLPKIILLTEYGTLAIIGVITFIFSMYPIEKVFAEFHFKKRRNLKFIVLLIVNLFIAFALILGKFERTHSWYVFTNLPRVLLDIKEVTTTPILLMMVFFFGLVINLIYFGFKNVISVTMDKQNRR